MLFFPHFVFLIKIVVLRSRDDTVYWYVKVNYIHLIQYMGSEVIQGLLG